MGADSRAQAGNLCAVSGPLLRPLPVTSLSLREKLSPLQSWIPPAKHRAGLGEASANLAPVTTRAGWLSPAVVLHFYAVGRLAAGPG